MFNNTKLWIKNKNNCVKIKIITKIFLNNYTNVNRRKIKVQQLEIMENKEQISTVKTLNSTIKTKNNPKNKIIVHLKNLKKLFKYNFAEINMKL